MKNTYRIILTGMVVLSFVYASTGSERKTNEIETKAEEIDKKSEEAEKKDKEAGCYESVDLCKFPVAIKVGHYVQLKGCNKRKIELKQVDCREIGREGSDFPCYKGSDVIEVRANFPAILNATIDKSSGDEDMLKEVKLYWENDVNTIQGCVGWEELKLCLEAWDVDLYMFKTGTIDIGDITIDVKPPDKKQKEKDVQETSQEVGDERARETSKKAFEEVSSEAVLTPRSSISVRSDVASSDFVGTWTGRTHDKPGEGTTFNSMVLHVLEPSKSDWKAYVSGTFPLKGKQEIKRIRIMDERIGFYMPASDGKSIVWLGLHPTEDDRLVGESFALEEGCAGRNIVLTRLKERKVRKHPSDDASHRIWSRSWDFRN